MQWNSWRANLAQRLDLGRFDLLAIALLCLGGALYLHNALHWGVGWIGSSQYGDAEFWWNDAIHVANGIFQDNPGKGFRPGYFVLTGLTLPVLGLRFQQFYPYFLATFLFAASFFYLALSKHLGKWVSLFVVAMLVINPFTAEWVATSTSDGLGLILSLMALSCLLWGVNKRLHPGRLAAFAVFFALATLTRPLLNLFIVVVALSILVLPRESFKKRLFAVAIIIMAFCLPTLMWMGAQKLTIDRWAISSNDASAFYAASDPKIQVWNNEMYTDIQRLAAEQNQITPQEVNDKLLNQTFWQETFKNYLRFPQYHLSRVLPNLWEVAHFSPKMATRGSHKWRIVFLDLIALGLASYLFMQRRVGRAFLLVALACWLSRAPQLVPFLTLLGAGLAISKRGHNNQLGLFLLSGYWLTGVLALFLIGGTWGPPSFSNLYAMNALGYRLGSQFFFVAELLAAYGLYSLAFAKSKPSWNGIVAEPIRTRWFQYWNNPHQGSGKLIILLIAAFVSAVLAVYALGTTRVVQRAYDRSHATALPYPSLAPVMALYQQKMGITPTAVKAEQGTLENNGLSLAKDKGKTLIFTGVISNFIWDFKGQARSQMLVHAQKNLSPLSLGPSSIILEVPQNPVDRKWEYQQGAFIISDLPNRHNDSNVPYYLTVPALRAFVPMAADGKSFDLDHATWFPLLINAAQLESDGALVFHQAKATWSPTSGPARFQRRFFLEPTSMLDGFSTLSIDLHLRGIQHSTQLSFAYKADKSENIIALPKGQYELLIKAWQDQGKTQELLSTSIAYNSDENEKTLQKINIEIPAKTERLEISFTKLLPGTGIWFYEFNLNTPAFVGQPLKHNDGEQSA